MKSILCLFSGGIDSTGVLYKLLTSQEYMRYSIHSHFIKIINRENRHIAETRAVESCVAWLKENCRSFTYTENLMDFSSFKNFLLWDSDITFFMAAEIIAASDNMYKYVAHGVTKTDVDFANYGRRIERSTNILTSIVSSYNKSIEKLYPIKDLTKQQVWDMLPDELRKHTWSCRRPIYTGDTHKPCGMCKTCKQMIDMKIGWYADK